MIYSIAYSLIEYLTVLSDVKPETLSAANERGIIAFHERASNEFDLFSALRFRTWCRFVYGMVFRDVLVLRRSSAVSPGGLSGLV